MDDVFRALADPTRRAILDRLFVDDGRSVQELSDQFPAMTRFGVMKHLGVLAAANLVTSRRAGRERHYFLNPVPIQQVADRWISKYAQPFTRALVDLQSQLERAAATTDGAAPDTSSSAAPLAVSAVSPSPLSSIPSSTPPSTPSAA